MPLNTFDPVEFEALLAEGFTADLGEPRPGALCVEAAVCLASGEPHGDEPTCVHYAVRWFVVNLNESPDWPSPRARAQGLRALAYAQLGTAEWSDAQVRAWGSRVAELAIRRVVPYVMEQAAEGNPEYADVLRRAADRCRLEGSLESVRAAARAARAAGADCAANAAYTAAYVANSTGGGAAYYTAYYAADPYALTLAADLAVDAIREIGSPGLAYLES